ncbi:MAG: protein phosphatase 2C domain-containing protein [Acidobacteriota bacterium]|nr:protein phosphatase 2C domain-containing protein [Acidobacteriota bacterium]
MRERAGLPGFADLLAGDQIPGARRYQEDCFRLAGFPEPDPDGCDLLMVLADGMGGHRGGAEASRLAVSSVVETFRQATGGVAARLRASLDAANAAVGRYAAEDARYAGMGCTLVACAVTDDETAHWISVGDSPLWRLHADQEGAGRDDGAGGMVRLNADHSLRPVLQDLVRLGRMTAEEAGGAAHQLRSAVDGDELTLVDEGTAGRLGTGDRIVLASDGLETLPDGEIQRLCGGHRTAAAVVADLLQAVEAAGRPSQDNATVLVYQHAGATGVRRRFERLTAPTHPVGRRRSGS